MSSFFTVQIGRTYHDETSKLTCEGSSSYPKAKRNMTDPKPRKRSEASKVRRALRQAAKRYGVPFKAYLRLQEEAGRK